MPLYYEDVHDSLTRRALIVSVLSAAGGVALRGQADWQPKFLDGSEDELLVTVGERIIPGSSASQAHRVIDLVLSMETPETQQGFRKALKAFANAKFTKLSAAEQDALLGQAANPGNPMNFSFEYLKEWIADAYWTSKEGMQELGFDGRLAWTEFNPCPHPQQR